MDRCSTDAQGRSDDIIAAVNASGEAFFGGVNWRGRRAMRMSVCNWRTTDEDIARAVTAIATALEQR